MNAWLRKTFVVLLLSVAPAMGETVKAKLYSSFLARGEKVLLEVRFDGVEPDGMPEFPKVENVMIEPMGYGPSEMVPGRRIEYRFQYVVSSYALGKHTIPAAEVVVGGVRYQTQPIEFEIFNPDDLTWNEVTAKPESVGEKVRYASIFKVPEKKIYQNQTVPSEIKIYIPSQLAQKVADWGVPEFERDGLAVWRYEAAKARGEVNLLGQSYIVMTYWTTMSPLRSGKVTIGPASVRLTYFNIVFDRFTQRVEFQAELPVSAYEFEVLPLPKGAPEGFDNAVGQFSLGTAIKQTRVIEGEPLSLDVVVTGSGNLDNLRSPQMIDNSGWKVYDASPSQRGEERREVSGTVIFSQFIRPLEMKSSIPPFRLVYFDPTEEVYKTALTEAIPLTMKSAVMGSGLEALGPPQALSLPIERMTDILGLVESGTMLMNGKKPFPFKIIQLAFGLFAFLLLVKALWMRYGHLLERDNGKLEMKKDFQKVLNTQGLGGLDFLRNAGGFAEKWLATAEDQEIGDIIRERDRLCFQKNKQETELPSKRRQQILRALRRAAFGMVLFAFFIPQARAEDLMAKATEAYEAAKYEEAAKLWLSAGPYSKLSADTLYNIGNSAYRMGRPGEAALYYRRALARDSTHAEARQNLRFIERKYGSITVDRPSYQYALAKFSLDTWRFALWIGSWVLVLSILVFFATRPGNRWRVVAVAGVILAPLSMSFAALGCYYYPNDAKFAPLARQAVIIGDKVVLHTDAARTSPEVIDAPPGSLAEVIYQSGRWVYVGFASQTRGWVPIESLEKIVPDKKPEPPKVRKSAADGSSA
jgi:tetratricopeptide (TPR) repeat protein